jgi:tetratricopeptide (TPR) repeat protein
MELLALIKERINRGEVSEAIRELDDYLDSTTERQDEAYYLRGNAYRKLGNWQQALNNYQLATDHNPNSPAREARSMVMDILNFYNKDIYNP